MKSYRVVVLFSYVPLISLQPLSVTTFDGKTAQVLLLLGIVIVISCFALDNSNATQACQHAL